MRTRERLTRAEIAVAAVAAAGCGSQIGAAGRGSDCTGPGAGVTASVSTPAPEETADMGSPWVDGSAVEQAVAYIGELAARSRYARYYSGVEPEVETQRVDVYRVPSAAFDAALCRGVPGRVVVRLHDTRASRTRAEAPAGRISGEWDRWDGRFGLRSVGADERGHVVCGVDDPRTAERLLRAAYGGLVRVRYEEQAGPA